MTDDNVTDLHYHRVCKAVGLDPNTVIEGNSARPIADYRMAKLRVLAEALSVSLDDAIRAVEMLQRSAVVTEVDEMRANRLLPQAALDVRSLPIIDKLLEQDPERRWAVTVRARKLYYLNRPRVFKEHKAAFQELRRTLTRGNSVEIKVAGLDAWMRWEIAHSVLDPSYDDTTLFDEMPIPPDEGVVDDVRRILEREKKMSAAPVPEPSGDLHSVTPERF